MKNIYKILISTMFVISVFCIFHQVYATTLTTNLVSYWKLDGNSNDAVGSNNGSDSNITYNTSYGIINQGALFNGTSGSIVIGSGLNSVMDSSAWSISFWFNPTSGYAGFIMANDNNTGVRQFDIYSNVNGSHPLEFDNAGANKLSGLGTNITAGAWQFYVLTYDGTTLSSYRNGVLDATNTMSALPTSTNGIYFGNRQYSSSRSWYKGDEDEIGLWSRALTSTEVSTLYNSGAGLRYPFNTSSPSTLFINSGSLKVNSGNLQIQ
jgi:hypothetical protein